MERKKGLGRGLSALIPEKVKFESEKYKEIELSEISLNPLQPRKTTSREELEELKSSIEKNGLLQPILVVSESSGYRLIAGERRFKAVEELGWQKIPAIVLERAEEVELLRKSLVENVQRSNLNPIEEASAYKKLIDEYDYSLDRIANEVGKDITTISNTIRLLNLPEEIKEDIIMGIITPGHARALLMLGDTPEILKMAQEIKAKRVSVREVERRVKRIKGKTSLEPNLEAVIDNLQKKLGTKVEIQCKKKGGRLEIWFLDGQDLERILNILIPGEV